MRKLMTTMGLLAAAILSLSACGGGDATSPSKSAGAAASSKRTDADQLTLGDFESIELGDVAKNGAGGVGKSELVSKWGKPISSSSATFQNAKTQLLTWNNVANADFTATMTVQLVSGRVVQKSIKGLRVRREHQLTLDDYNSIQTGATESDVVSRLGKPNGYSESLLNGAVTKELSYTSSIKGQSGANFAITVQGGKVMLKTQTKME